MIPWRCKGCGGHGAYVVGLKAKIVGWRAVIVTHLDHFDDRH
jgi:hypothetical protein